MWFLLKCAFWLSVVVLVLPIPESERRAETTSITTGEAVSALSAALQDIRGFCTRNPEACATGGQAAHTFGQKAQAGARMLHEFISQQLDENRHLVPPPGSRAAASPATGADTLTAEDREPAWRAPAAQPQRRV